MKIFCLTIFGAVFLLVPQLQADVIAYWRFENDLTDSGTNSLNLTGGTGFGYSTAVPGSTINPGGLSNVASYDQGTGSTLLGANSAMSDTFSLGSFTLEAFVYLNPTASNFQQLIYNENVGTTSGIYFGVGRSSLSGHVDGYNGNGAHVSGNVGTGLAAETWTHVAWVGTYTAVGPDRGTTVQFFVDGSAVGGPTYFGYNGAVHITMNADDWKIGGTSNNFDGLFDEMRLSNAALTPAEFLIAVPEPGTLLSLALGCGLLLTRRVRRKTS